MCSSVSVMFILKKWNIIMKINELGSEVCLNRLFQSFVDGQSNSCF